MQKTIKVFLKQYASVHMIKIKFHNSKVRKKEIFEPIDPSNVRMYLCGPTVYDRAHLGNARNVIVFDVLFRFFREVFGARYVKYVRNFTDIDDKINQRAKDIGKEIKVITDETIAWYLEDMELLGNLAPSEMPKATDFVPHMILMIEGLIKSGHAYEAQGHVMFSVESYKDYGSLSGRSIEDMLAGARVEIAPYKVNPLDFVLWKPSSDDLPGWVSPWGRGRPGWHLECSAMTHELLGESFDIHGGGNDLMFPHHENELAQSKCCFPSGGFANFWLHNEMLQVDGKKMSKSLGNFITIDELKSKYDGQVLRLAMLSTHYRQPFDWNDKILEDAKKILGKWYEFYSQGTVEIDEENLNPLLDDLNTPLYISNLHSLYDKASKGDRQSAMQLSSACKLIGLFNKDLETWSSSTISKLIDENEVKNLLHERNIAREQKNFVKSDQIRELLNSKGIAIEDKDGKTNWKYK